MMTKLAETQLWQRTLASLIRSGLFTRAETGESHGLYTVVGIYGDGTASAPLAKYADARRALDAANLANRLATEAGRAVESRDAMNQLFQESFVRPVAAMAGGAAALPLDIAETKDEFIVKASLPGMRPEDVQITVHGDTLTIRAEGQAEEERKDQNWLVRERRFGAFQRSVSLTCPISSEKAQAQFDHGVLTLVLPKAEEAKPRQIRVGGQAPK